jgi:predicted HicB family RNase H-like nuclease
LGISYKDRSKVMMEYKGYTCHFNFDEDADIFHGKILGIRDVITFQGRSLDELKTALYDSIDDYLEMCK